MCLFFRVFEYFDKVVWEWMVGRLVVEEVCLREEFFLAEECLFSFFSGGRERHDVGG